MSLPPPRPPVHALPENFNIHTDPVPRGNTRKPAASASPAIRPNEPMTSFRPGSSPANRPGLQGKQIPATRPGTVVDTTAPTALGNRLAQQLAEQKAIEAAEAERLADESERRKQTSVVKPRPAVRVQPRTPPVADTLAGLADEAPVVVGPREGLQYVRAPQTVNPSMLSKTSVCPPGFLRVEMPSRCLPYDFNDVFLRSLTVDELSLLSAAIEANGGEGDYTAMLDALSSAVLPDVRALTDGDFTMMMYWMRINSYPRTPYTMRWRSRYGNEQTKKLNMGNLEIQELKMTAADVAHYRSLGVRFPTIRDEETLRNVSKVSERDKFAMARASFMALSPEDEAQLDPSLWLLHRMEVLKLQPATILEDMRDFKAVMGHGVKETIESIDDQFEPVAAAAYLTRVAEDLFSFVANADPARISAERLANANAKARGLMDEANEILEKLKANEEAEANGGTLVEILPRKEVTTVETNMLDFFPSV